MLVCVRIGICHQLSDFPYSRWLQYHHPASRHVGNDARSFGHVGAGNSTFLRKDQRSFKMIDWHTALLTAVALNTIANLFRLYLEINK